MEQKRTWLDGPALPGENDLDGPGKWPGEKLGLPEHGPGSLASVARRTGAVLIDWIVCMLLANLIAMTTDFFGGPAFLGYALWVVVGIITGWLFARTPGMMMLGMGVARLDAPGERVGFWRAALRTILTAFLFPAAMVDSDGRGIHDRATGTAVIMA
ncbi:RDD family protein [Corynebacterium sp.]|uniref:RDD family protein n=1 Tax=Corynebacterium sp. TaxID=1720 RepID=UPI0026DB5220|nr:RDD family protein [Corynebacterium sp.]MDO5031342.1 RDD family protein [Corynebacterium sp.]